MVAAPVRVKIRVISCQHCGKPIRLSPSMLKREANIKQGELSFDQGLQSRVFTVRCIHCHKEAIYSLNQITDIATEDSATKARPQIVFVGMNREPASKGYKPSLTCNFTISDGAKCAHAEVIFTDGGDQIIERRGKDIKMAARMALEQRLVQSINPFLSLLFVRISSEQAAYFAKHGNFHRSLHGSVPDIMQC